MNKTARQHRIAQLLSEQAVTSQSSLVELLSDAEIEVNQATVSRDLEELGAIKIRIPGSESAYAIPELPVDQVAPADHLRRVLSDWVAEINRSGDLVVLRTPPGSAHVVASAIDRSSAGGYIGTVAGDDTLLVIAAEGSGAQVQQQLAELAGL